MVTEKEMLNEFDFTITQARQLISARGQEYSGEEDTLSTFRMVSQMTGLRPAEVAFVLLCVKVARLKKQISEFGINNRIIPRDSIQDLINYAIYHIPLLGEQ